MNGLFGNFGGCGCDNNCNRGCDGVKKGCGLFGNMDCCTIILILLLLTGCVGCDIDWCTIIVIYLLFTTCGLFGHKEHC